MWCKNPRILEFNNYQVYDKAPFIIYKDLESLIEKIVIYKNNCEKSSTTKVSKDIPSGFQFLQYGNWKIENKHDVYRGKDCMKKFVNPWESTQWR